MLSVCFSSKCSNRVSFFAHFYSFMFIVSYIVSSSAKCSSNLLSVSPSVRPSVHPSVCTFCLSVHLFCACFKSFWMINIGNYRELFSKLFVRSLSWENVILFRNLKKRKLSLFDRLHFVSGIASAGHSVVGVKGKTEKDQSLEYLLTPCICYSLSLAPCEGQSRGGGTPLVCFSLKRGKWLGEILNP